MKGRQMVKDNNPWNDNDDDKYSGGEKVIQLNPVRVAKQDNNLNFNPMYVVIFVLLIWLASGFYQVQTNEQGVV